MFKAKYIMFAEDGGKTMQKKDLKFHHCKNEKGRPIEIWLPDLPGKVCQSIMISEKELRKAIGA